MTVTMAAPTALRSYENMVCFSENAQQGWRQFAIGALAVFKGHKFGHSQLFNDTQVIDSITGFDELELFWPGRLMSALHSRGYSIATSCVKDYEQLAEGGILDKPAALGLKDEEHNYIVSNARIVRGLFNIALPSILLDAVETGKPDKVVRAFLEQNWAVMLTSPGGESTRAFFPIDSDELSSKQLLSGATDEIILHAVKHPMY